MHKRNVIIEREISRIGFYLSFGTKICPTKNRSTEFFDAITSLIARVVLQERFLRLRETQ